MRFYLFDTEVDRVSPPEVVFQPFLRFYPLQLIASGCRKGYVSTLLEILLQFAEAFAADGAIYRFQPFLRFSIMRR